MDRRRFGRCVLALLAVSIVRLQRLPNGMPLPSRGEATSGGLSSDLESTANQCCVASHPLSGRLAGGPDRGLIRWRSGEEALCWTGAAGLESEKSFRKIMGHQDLCMLRAALHEGPSESKEASVSVDEDHVAA